jgi:serine protease Do
MGRYVLTACIALFAAHTTKAAEFDRALFMRMAMTTVRIEALAPDNHYNMGTGVIVAPGRVVTSCHVTGPAPLIRVLYSGLRLTVRKQRHDIHNDLCMLEVPELDAPPAEVGTASTLQIGDRVIAMGFTGGYELQFADGVVRGLYPDQGAPVIKSSTAFNSGSSGGGLFDANGKLVGILTFRLRGTGDCYYSMPVDHFKSWTDTLEGFETPQLLTTDVPVWQAPYEKQPLFLKAAYLELVKDWGKLKELAKEWTQREPNSGVAWLTLGKAHAAQNDIQDSIPNLKKATDLEPQLGEAWYELALAAKVAGHDAEFDPIHKKLEVIDPDLALQLDSKVSLLNEAKTK